jgi:hypothetical protein
VGGESFIIIDWMDRAGHLVVKNHFIYQVAAKFTKVWYWASHFEQVWHATLLMAKSVTLEIMFS